MSFMLKVTKAGEVLVEEVVSGASHIDVLFWAMDEYGFLGKIDVTPL